MPEFLHREGDKYYWSGGFETKDLPKQAGFKWDPVYRRWWTTVKDNAAKLVKYADPETKQELEEYTKQKEQSLSLSRASSADIVLPAPQGLDYLPFQKAGIQYALSRKNVLIGDAMGLGKTIQAIGVINALPEVKNVLIVSPASLKLNWKRELEKWLVRPMSIGVSDDELPRTDVVIVNYDMLGKFKDELMARDWDVLIADEAQYVKNPKAQRTQHLVGYEEKKGDTYIHVPGIADRAKRKLFLTGTPILNRPIELWPIVSTLAPDVFPNFMAFAKRYAGAKLGQYGWDFSGASNLEELQEKLRSSIMVRRLKQDVLKELPTKRRQVVELEPDSSVRKLLAHEREVIAKHESKLEDLRAEAELARLIGTEEEYKEAVRKLRDASQVAFEEISRERHELALAKVPYVIDYVKDALEQEDKLVVFAHHRDVIDQIAKAFPAGEVVTLTGEDSVEDRQKAVDAFQNDPKVKLFVGSIHAAGVGLTLTAASHVIFAELDWVPGNITQAEDRLHRIGQQDSVLVQHLVFDGSLDSKMAKTLVEKQEIIDRALDIEPPPVTMVDEPATRQISRKAVSEFEDLTEDQIAEVRAALRYLAGVDDGAVRRDDAGFNKVDTAIGQRLASLPSLTQEQAKLGAVLVQKYRNQLASAGIKVPDMPVKRSESKEESKRTADKSSASVASQPSGEQKEAAKPESERVTLFEFELPAPTEDWKSHSKRITYSNERGWLTVRFPYDPGLITKLKSAVRGIRFDRGSSLWYLSTVVADSKDVQALVEYGKQNDFVFGPKAIEEIKRILEDAGGKVTVAAAPVAEQTEAGASEPAGQSESSGTEALVKMLVKKADEFKRTEEQAADTRKQREYLWFTDRPVQVGSVVKKGDKLYKVAHVMSEFVPRNTEDQWYEDYAGRMIYHVYGEPADDSASNASYQLSCLQQQLQDIQAWIRAAGRVASHDYERSLSMVEFPPDNLPRLLETVDSGVHEWFVADKSGIWYMKQREGGELHGWKVAYDPILYYVITKLAEIKPKLEKGEPVSESDLKMPSTGLYDIGMDTIFDRVPSASYVIPVRKQVESDTGSSTGKQSEPPVSPGGGGSGVTTGQISAGSTDLDNTDLDTEDKLRRVHEARPDSSRMQDELLSNKRTATVEDEHAVEVWLNDPGRVDIVGIDTPAKPKFIKRRKKAISKGKGTADKLKDRDVLGGLGRIRA